MPERYRVENWSEYNQALVQRGSLSFWMSEEAIRAWRYGGPQKQGGEVIYSDLAIETCLCLRLLYSLPLRQTQGFVASLFALLGVELPVPDYSTLSRRQASLAVDLDARADARDEEPLHLVLDSTGLKVYRAGEWARRKHGVSKRRTWRKLHLGADAKTGRITATTLSENREHDSSQALPLLEESEQNCGSIAQVGADGAYDKRVCYHAIEAHAAQPVIPPQKNARIQQHGNAEAPPLPRDEAIRYIRAHGLARWKAEHGYHRRSMVEAVIGRFKRIIGRRLRSRELRRQRTEARLGCQILNRMAALGTPMSVPALT